MLLEGLRQLKKTSDLIGTRTRDLLTLSIVPQPSTVPRASRLKKIVLNLPDRFRQNN
jgi:hypothetical protein